MCGPDPMPKAVIPPRVAPAPVTPPKKEVINRKRGRTSAILTGGQGVAEEKTPILGG